MMMVRAAQGFSTIELLVVCALLSLLAAILLPVLVTSKRNALVSEDINAMRQWDVAARLYAIDHDDLVRLSAHSAIETWRFDETLLRSQLDSSPKGYANCVLYSRGGLPRRVSFLALDDVAPGLEGKLSDGGDGWLAALIDTPVARQTNICAIEFAGSYNRLTNAGGVVRRHLRIFVEPSVSTFYYNSLFTDQESLWWFQT